MRTATIALSTQLGRIAVAAVAAMTVLWILVVALDVNTTWLIPIFLVMLAGGAAGVAASVRQGERSLLVFVALVPVVFLILALIAEVTGLIE